MQTLTLRNIPKDVQRIIEHEKQPQMSPNSYTQLIYQIVRKYDEMKAVGNSDFLTRHRY